MARVFERNKESKKELDPSAEENLRPFQEDFSWETLQGMREMEDYLIHLGRMSEGDRVPTPSWLADDAESISADRPEAD